jgi:hypothetical protein
MAMVLLLLIPHLVALEQLALALMVKLHIMLALARLLMMLLL